MWFHKIPPFLDCGQEHGVMALSLCSRLNRMVIGFLNYFGARVRWRLSPGGLVFDAPVAQYLPLAMPNHVEAVMV